MAAEVVRRGLRVVYPLTDEPWGVRRFFVEDPGGTIVNVLGTSADLDDQASAPASRKPSRTSGDTRMVLSSDFAAERRLGVP